MQISQRQSPRHSQEGSYMMKQSPRLCWGLPWILPRQSRTEAITPSQRLSINLT